jgi:hypothetical protein
MSTTQNQIPESCPFAAEGAKGFEIQVPTDVKTRTGNVILPAGRYTAWESEDTFGDLKPGTVTVFTEGRHYAGCEWASILATRYSRVERAARPKTVMDLPIARWAWQGDARQVER